MQIDHCLILAAGLGTRMGEIGKILPKILWPVFESTLLELQLNFAKSLGVKNVYINTHYLSESVESFIKEKGLDVTPIFEDKLLDVGGAIYNMAARSEVDYSGNLLILNGDQFLCFDRDLYQRGLEELKVSDVVLFGISVPGGKGYRETLLRGNSLVEIVPPSDGRRSYSTYSGVGLVSLNRLEPQIGVQSFFDSVANFNSRKVHMLLPDHYEYWDFGTIARYWESSFKLLEQPKSDFYQYLENIGAIVSSKISSGGYDHPGPIINLSKKMVQAKNKIQGITLDGDVEVNRKGIYYQKTVDLL